MADVLLFAVTTVEITAVLLVELLIELLFILKLVIYKICGH